MTRKTFEFIAATIRNMPDRVAAEKAALALATDFSAEFPRFSATKFLVAAGVATESQTFAEAVEAMRPDTLFAR